MIDPAVGISVTVTFADGVPDDQQAFYANRIADAIDRASWTSDRGPFEPMCVSALWVASPSFGGVEKLHTVNREHAPDLPASRRGALQGPDSPRTFAEFARGIFGVLVKRGA